MFSIIKYYSYKFIFLLTLLCITSNSAYSHESTWNIVKDNENWDIFAYRPPTVKRRIALSLGRLQEALKHSEIKPETPLPITQIRGIIFDDSGDIIVLGIEESGDGVVNIVPDDIILAMRSMLISDEPPGMSIDPRLTKDGTDMGPVQDVVYFGGIKNTRPGLFAFYCDYWMKQLAAGKINVPLEKFSRYSDLVIDNQKILSVGKGNRFWFYPKESQFTISPDYEIMLLQKSGVEVLTEEQHFIFEKKLFKDLYSSKKIDPFAKKFTDQFTTRYGELSSVYPDLARLKNFFALCELFKWAEKRGIQLRLWKYLLYECNPVQVHTPSKADTVKVMLFSLGTRALFLVGGVQGEIRLPAKPIIDKSGKLVTLRKTIYISRPSSDAIYWEYSSEERLYANSPVIERRLKDIKEAGRNLRNGLIIDLFVCGENVTYGNIVDSSGRVKGIAPDATNELRHLIKSTVNTKAKLGEQFLKKWDSFYDTHLKSLNKPTYWNSPDDKLIKLKPVLIIKSNEVNYKYANLEKVPALADNFIVFIASKQREGKNVAKTTAEELTKKIKDIPRLSRENVVFAIRPPRSGVAEDMRKKWKETTVRLEQVVGIENVLFNPSKQDFTKMLNNQEKEIIVIELTHTEEGITLNGNEIYTSLDILKGGNLSHIKYLIAGNTCSLPQLEKGELAAAFRKKGVGIMNTSFGKVSMDTVLKRLRELIRVLENIDGYDLPTYYLPDIIDQLIDAPDPERERGTTNLGKLDYRQKHLVG